MTKQKPDPINKEEVEKIINQAFIDKNDYAYTIFNFAKKTGKRLGEIYNLKVKNYQPERKIIYTQILKRRRSVEKETILDEELCLILNRWILSQKLKEEDFIFHKRTYRQIQNLIKKYAKKAGINKNISMHSFRHYFITSLVRQGWPYDKIQKLTGHANLSTLNFYDSATALDIEKEARNSMKSL